MAAAAIAYRAYAATLFNRKGVWILIGIAVLFLLFSGMTFLMSRFAFFSEESLRLMREFAILPGVPIAALLMSEMPIRDGIRHRTLLYNILAPVPRSTLLVVRTLVTALVLAAIMSLTVSVVHVMEGGGFGHLPREILAIGLGSAAYVSIFGLIHIVTSRGLIAGLALTIIIDIPLGTFPFGLRNLTPSYHVRALADQIVDMDLPMVIQTADPSLIGSSVALLVITAIAIVLGAMRFSRMSLGEIV